jgi:dihydroxyacetone kinase-like protein
MFVGDDAAIDFPEDSLLKPRGVAGTSLLYKILGAASFEGADLDKMVELGDEVLKNLSTFGTSMECCSLPGHAKSHDLKDDEIEIGMGIHGEPGREKVKWIQNH